VSEFLRLISATLYLVFPGNSTSGRPLLPFFSQFCFHSFSISPDCVPRGRGWPCFFLSSGVVVVVVVIAQQLFSYHQLSRLRKSATTAGLSHRSCTVSCVGWLWQLNRCSTECGETPHSRQTSDNLLLIAPTHKRMARLGWPGWLVQTKTVYPPTDGHPSKN